MSEDQEQVLILLQEYKNLILNVKKQSNKSATLKDQKAIVRKLDDISFYSSRVLLFS